MLLAPNGKQSNLNEFQWNQVRTHEFISWFGDWINKPTQSSKVVDENGEPLVVYHSSNEQFDVFDTSKIKYVGNDGDGFYFTPDLDQTLKYGKNTRQFFLDIKNPLSPNVRNLTVTDYKKLLDYIWKDEDYGQDLKNYGYFDDYDYIKFRNNKAKELASKDDYNSVFDLTSTSVGSVRYISEAFTKIGIKGFDGVISPIFREWVTFLPNQIKSATNNNGNFDKNNPTINESN